MSWEPGLGLTPVESEPTLCVAAGDGVRLELTPGDTLRLRLVNCLPPAAMPSTLQMMRDAQKAGVSVLVTAGQQDFSYNLTEPNLWADLLRSAQPFVKWAYEPRRLADLLRAIHRI
jgi:hypothetical protein